MSDCHHDKVYSGESLWTLTPKWTWICALCHATGTDQQEDTPPVDRESYLALLEHVDPEGAAGMRRLFERMR